ncbi:hypothetical protein HDU85_000830 [Gaertneriomyces sp. JEL0708]|nr:hypothetical protein HDU85_000830 [Gaertneriomyces sp. JEL0708]
MSVPDGQSCALNDDCMSGACVKPSSLALTGTCKAQLGGTCIGSEDCAGPDALCKDDPDDLNGGKKCERLIPRSASQLCAVGSDCTSTICSKSDPTDSTGVCQEPLGGTCEADSHCADATAKCKDVDPNGNNAGKVCGLAIEAADGEPCAVNSDCESSTCTKGDPATDSTGFCKAPLGWTCSVDGDCADSNAECKVVDPNDLTAGQVCGLAIEAADGEPCALNSDCESSTCTKGDPATDSTGICKAPLGRTCSVDGDCADATAKCKDVEPNGSNAGKVCGLAIEVDDGEPCAVNSDCMSGACARDNLVNPTGICKAPLGEICNADDDCADPAAECKAVDPNDVTVGMVCGLANQVVDGQACALDSDCESEACVKEDPAYSTGICKAQLGGTCSINEDCADAAAAECKYVDPTDVTAGQVCGLANAVDDGEECAVDSDCTSGACARVDPVNPTGICKAPLGETCTVDDDCADVGAECKGVDPNDVTAGQVCGLATAVADDQACAVNSDCSGPDSTCRVISPAKAGVCTPLGAHGQGCAVVAPKCNANTLECKNDICVRKAANKVAPGGACAVTADCSEGTCIKVQLTATLGKCLKTIGQSCSGDHCSTDLTCRTATPRLCVRSNTKTVPLFGACAVSADCEDLETGKPGFCEKANATRSLPGQCVQYRAMGVECSVGDDCASSMCWGDPKKCWLSASGSITSRTVTLPAVPVVAGEPHTVTIPGGVNMQLTPSLTGDVQVVARGVKQVAQPAPPGAGLGLFLTIELPTDATVTGATLDFEYTPELQAAKGNVSGDALTWYTFDEDATKWIACETKYDEDTRILSCATDHFSDWTIATKVSAAFAACMPHLLTVLAATALSVSMFF